MVHAKGCFIYLQLWAQGRAADPKVMKEDGHEIVSASDIPINSESGVPRPLRVDEIEEYVELYARAAENAMQAGFDGVEIHR